MKYGWLRRASLLPALLFAAIPLAFLIGVVAFQLSVAVPGARDARRETVASFESLRAASAVDEAVQDAERGQRGYLLTGRDTYLQPYTHAQEVLPELMARLQRSTAGSGELQARLLSLQSHLTTKMNELDSTIHAFRTQSPDAARAIVQTDLGRESMLAIQADLTAINEAANARLSALQARAAEAESVVTKTFVVGSVVSGLALVLGSLLLAYAYGRAATSEETLRTTLDSVREGVGGFDGSGRLRIWNEPFARMLDIEPAALVPGRPIPIEQGSKPDIADIVARIGELDATARRTGRPTLVTHSTRRGATLELFHSRVNDGYVTTVLDVSDQRQAEEGLRQAQKLEALGQMTGGVAHDFNNLLTIIIGSLAFLRRSVGDDRKSGERIDMIQIAADRGAKLTRQLLAFARRQPLQPDVVDLSSVMLEILPLLRRAVGEGIAVEYVGGGGLWNTKVDTAQFQSAMLNLAINARDAMSDGGKLTVEVSNAALDDLYAARHAEVEAGQYVVFAVTDTGRGMDPSVMARAMDPFFTTKPPGEGTGLGLPQVYGFVKQSGGHVKLYSEVGEGTTVKMYLPRSLLSAAPGAVRPSSLAVIGTETVLLVDDDDVVRTTVAAMLEDLGYTVLAVASGAQAIAVLEQGARIDLLFTDVVMPGMSGRQLAERALAIAPALKILFTSGYTENAIVHNGRLDPGVELLSKAYDRERLASKVRRVLDAARPATGPDRSAAG